MTPVFLWTDWLVDGLLICCLIFILWARHQAHMLRPWRRVMRDPLAGAAMIILALFVCIGVLDSLHFTNVQHQTRSVLDVLLSPLGTMHEKTYSAPFATHLFNKETHITSEGTVERIYPALQYAQLSNPLSSNLVHSVYQGASIGVVLSLLLLLMRRLFSPHPLWQWRQPWTAQQARWATACLLLILCSILYTLSRTYHVLGTDKVGQDVFYATIKSIRTGLIIGTLTTLVMLPFATLLGSFAGYWGGRIDDVIQYLYTTLSAIPGVLLIAAAILSIQVYIANHPEHFPNLESRADMRLLALCVILGVTSWTSLCRIIRAETLKLREMDYVHAAKVLGVRAITIIVRHIIPNVMPIILITVVLDFSGLVLAEAVLSYVGVGVDPTAFSWGNMINAARLELAREPVVWWPLLSAFIAMFSLVLSANLFADAVREAFDPRHTDAN